MTSLLIYIIHHYATYIQTKQTQESKTHRLPGAHEHPGRQKGSERQKEKGTQESNPQGVSDFGFPRRRRIVRKTDFKRVLDNGKRLADRDFTLWDLSGVTGGGETRLGIIVARKALGCAVKRNRARRLIREVFRLRRHLLAQGHEVIMYPRNDRNLDDFSAMERAVLGIWQKAGIYKNPD